MLLVRQFGIDKPELIGAMAFVMKQMKSKSAYRLGNMKEPMNIKPIGNPFETVGLIMRKNMWKQCITYAT